MATLNASTFASRADAERYYLSLIDVVTAKARAIDPVQAEVYQEKVAEVRVGAGPLLAAEAKMLGVELETLHRSVMRNHGARQQHVHRIELNRIKAKAEVRNAATAAVMHLIYKEFKEAL